MENQCVTLEELVQNMIFAVQTSGRSPRTCQYYHKLLSAFLGFARSECWPQDPNMITPNHIRHFLAWTASRTGTYSTGHGSVRHHRPKATKSWPYYKAIRRLYNWGIDEKLVASNPAAAVRYKAPPPAPVMPYSAGEIRAFMAICELYIKEATPFTGIRGKACLIVLLAIGDYILIKIGYQVQLKNNISKRSGHLLYVLLLYICNYFLICLCQCKINKIYLNTNSHKCPLR